MRVHSVQYSTVRGLEKILKYSLNFIQLVRTIDLVNGLRTPGEAIALDARPKIKSQSQIYRNG